jgi:hypothetical protein
MAALGFRRIPKATSALAEGSLRPFYKVLILRLLTPLLLLVRPPLTGIVIINFDNLRSK